MPVSAIYKGRVKHARLAPRKREFSHAVYMMYLDLTELPEVFQRRWLWSATRAAPMRFRREDYYGDPGVPLDQSIRELVREQTGESVAGPVRVLTNLRSFGYIFNPISVYYVFDQSDRLRYVIADVTNIPWRQSHPYVFKADEDGLMATGTAEKVMHVSPFLEMDYTYRLVASRPAVKLEVIISNSRDGKLEFSAGLRLNRHEATAGNLRRTLLRFPAMAIGVTASIFAQSLRMKLRGFKWYPNPANEATTQISNPIPPLDPNTQQHENEIQKEKADHVALG